MRRLRIKYETLLPVYHLIWRRWRGQRWDNFKKWMQPANSDRILDVGGIPSEWRGKKSLIDEVDLVGLVVYQIPENPDTPTLRSFKGDGRALEFGDMAYDIVYSNSVIEHVGTWSDQQAFAKEVRRVGRGLWVQTPAFACPVEPHYLGLFIHWFPRTWHVPIAKWTSVVGLSGAADLQSIADSTRLLTKSEFKKLFPDCEIWTERLLFLFPKSYVAMRKAKG